MASAVPQPVSRWPVIGCRGRLAAAARTSCMVNTPRRPMSQRAAVSAPSAKTRRSRASCTSRTCSKGASNTSSWVPGTEPTRTLVTGSGSPERARSRARERGRGAGGRVLLRGVVGLDEPRVERDRREADAPLPPRRGRRSRRRPRSSARTAGRRRARSTAVVTRGSSSYHPVVPTTTGIPARCRRAMFPTAAPASVNSMATAAPRRESPVRLAGHAASMIARRPRTRVPARDPRARGPCGPSPTSARGVPLIRAPSAKKASCSRRIAGDTCSPSTTTVRLIRLELSESMWTRRSPIAASARDIEAPPSARPFPTMDTMPRLRSMVTSPSARRSTTSASRWSVSSTSPTRSPPRSPRRPPRCGAARTRRTACA